MTKISPHCLSCGRYHCLWRAKVSLPEGATVLGSSERGPTIHICDFCLPLVQRDAREQHYGITEVEVILDPVSGVAGAGIEERLTVLLDSFLRDASVEQLDRLLEKFSKAVERRVT